MIYGYHGERGQWWHDNVSVALSPELRAGWLANSYEVCEVAVSPAYQSFGIGRALIGRLLAGCTEDTCVLTTRVDSRAHELYARLGFEVVVTMRFFSEGHEFYVMGKRLRDA
jgi:ribosomal protein S18 acetylase RimI-like enzyme